MPNSVARRRFQDGQLIKTPHGWYGRYREDVRCGNGETRRIRPKKFLGDFQTLPTKRLALKELGKILQRVNHVDYQPVNTITVRAFLEQWKEQIMVLHKPSTQQGEAKIVRHLTAAFGNLQLTEIDTQKIQSYISRSKLSPKSIKNIVVQFGYMWKTAKAWKYVDSNPFEGVRKPTVIKGKNTYNFTIDEAGAIIDAAEGVWKLFFRLAAETGSRPGELAGLRIMDIHPRFIRISQSVWGQKVQTPKTQNALREPAISLELENDIRAYIQERFHNQYVGTELLFTTRKGTPLNMANFRTNILNPILVKTGIRAKLDQLGLKRCGLYAFRHMNATIMDELQTPLKTRQVRLGHADPGTTLDHYTHMVDADNLRVADQIGALLKAAAEKMTSGEGSATIQ